MLLVAIGQSQSDPTTIANSSVQPSVVVHTKVYVPAPPNPVIVVLLAS